MATKEWEFKNAGRRKARARQMYHAEPSRREGQLIRNKRWRDAHPEREKEKALKRRAANPEHAREIARLSYLNNIEKRRTQARERNPDARSFYNIRFGVRSRKAKAIFDQLSAVNPGIVEAVAGAKDQGRAMLRALSVLGVNVEA